MAGTSLGPEELLSVSLRRQFLTHRAPCERVVSKLCGLQAQFANNPKYALRIRGSDFDGERWNRGLVKTWTLRKTLHLVLEKELGLFLSAQGIPGDWQDGWGLAAGRMAYWAEFLLDRINRGIRGREELKKQCRERGISAEEEGNVFHGWGGLLYEMSRRGLIAYHSGTAKQFLPCPPIETLPRDEARAVILRRYFESFGPAAVEDCRAFTGYRQRELDALIRDFAIKLRPLSCGGKEYFYLGELPEPRPLPACVFLTGFDQLIMGYRDRSRVMDAGDRNLVITNSGIVHPTVLIRGRLRASWKKDGTTLLIRPFRPLSPKDRSLAAETGREVLAGEIDDCRFAPPEQ
ncbi:MAG: winged helix DNA-binding domain-containing protein [Treponema sp.]|jgi:hypothetical protein|nr:winged helix DNA-binding domain-containing protein [Treponema sp.]